MSELLIQRISIDSRQVKPGDLFMAVQGFTHDGREYIDNAIQKGAVAVLVETQQPLNENANPHIANLALEDINLRAKANIIPVIPIPNLRELIGPIASRFYGEPSKQIPVIGITGTNGKTSTSHFLAEILTNCAKPCGIIGTLGIGFPGKLDEINHTTPDPITVQQALATLRDQAAKAVAMEVTSHALDQSRVSGVAFHTAIFTNLSRDHLDYHANLEEYANAKQKLFLEYHPKFSVINLDDPVGVQLMNAVLNQPRLTQQPGSQPKVIGYTTSAHSDYAGLLNSIISTQNLSYSAEGMQASITTPWGTGELYCPLLGHFNFSNLLAAIAAACLQNIPLTQVLKAVSNIQTVNGRMMRFGGTHGLPLVVVDYAHTPDALTKVLTAVRAHCQAKLWCVFGCGGDRDRGKRPLMASEAERLSDKLCITQDNPRNEDPQQIINEIVSGLTKPDGAVIELNRKEAIFKTIMAAKPEDCVVIAGKGHETYQIIGTQKIPFSDIAEVHKALQERSK